jgi:hypothetical protein
MDKVWRALSKQNAGGSFLLPASVSVPGASAEERQIGAMSALLDAALDAMILSEAVITRRQAEEKRNRFLAKAEELRADADEWNRKAPAACKGLWHEERHDDYDRRLLAASDAYEEMAFDWYEADIRWAVERARADGRAKWYAHIIADKCRALFGSAMYGITATITSVALSQGIGESTVQQWCSLGRKSRPKSRGSMKKPRPLGGVGLRPRKNPP